MGKVLMMSAACGSYPLLFCAADTPDGPTGIYAIAEDAENDQAHYASHFTISTLYSWWKRFYTQEEAVYEEGPVNLERLLGNINTCFKTAQQDYAADLTLCLVWKNNLYFYQFGAGEVFLIDPELKVVRLNRESKTEEPAGCLGQFDGNIAETTRKQVDLGKLGQGRFLVADKRTETLIKEEMLVDSITKEHSEACSYILEELGNNEMNHENSIIISDFLESFD